VLGAPRAKHHNVRFCWFNDHANLGKKRIRRSEQRLQALGGAIQQGDIVSIL
jgi:hypothetical protein